MLCYKNNGIKLIGDILKNMKINRIIKCNFIILSILFTALTCCADIVYLENGSVMKGIVTQEENGNITLAVGIGKIYFKKEEVLKVEFSSESEKQELQKQWKKTKTKVKQIDIVDGNIFTHETDAFYKKLLKQFQSNPTEELMKNLVDVLDTQKVSVEVGNNILKALMNPVIVKRDAYITGRDAYIRIKYPFKLIFSKMACEESTKMAIGDNYVSEASYSNGSILGGDSWPDSPGGGYSPDSPGILKIKVELDFGIIHSREGKNWINTARIDKPVYKCSFRIPVTLNFVEEKNIKPISLFSNPSIDKKVKSSFSITASDFPLSLKCVRAKKEVIYNSSIIYSNLPTDVGLNILLVDNNGREYSLTSRPLDDGFTAVKGASGKVTLKMGWHTNFDSLPFGVQKAKIILKSNKKLVYSEPEIQQIWNGELEFPIIIDVKKI